ncbi:unnamed protein product, partial [Polarella glacialis]
AGTRDFKAACADCYQTLLKTCTWSECAKEERTCTFKTCTEALSTPEFQVAPFDWTPDVRLEIFGSTRQGTALMCSDLDVRMSFEQFSVHGQERQLKYLRGVAAAPGPRFEVLQTIVARLPLLRLRFDGWLEVDLTMGDSAVEGPWIDKSVIRLLAASVDAGATQFVQLVKAFSKTHKLVDAYNGFLNSTSWTCLAMTFLQEEGCLPPLKLVEDCSKAALWPVRLTIGLISRFFAFMERSGHKPHRVSLQHGDVRSTRHRNRDGGAAHPLFVQHPEKDGVNLASALSFEGWRQTVEKCTWARQHLVPSQGSTDLRKAVQDVFGIRSASISVPACVDGVPVEATEPPRKRLCREEAEHVPDCSTGSPTS